MSLRLLALLTVFSLLQACTSTRSPAPAAAPNAQLEALKVAMTGDFDSSSQAAMDGDYYSINLHMQPIWTDQPGHYLYVEQSVEGETDEPYRQRVYELSQKNRKTFVSKIYELPGADRFIGAHSSPDRLNVITPADLIVREGCAIYFKQDKGGVYRGRTKKKHCKSSLEGASYSTSRVSVSGSFVQAWDRGYNADGKQVWGATEGGFLFFPKKSSTTEY